jgi:hypothetical protein
MLFSCSLDHDERFSTVTSERHVQFRFPTEIIESIVINGVALDELRDGIDDVEDVFGVD